MYTKPSDSEVGYDNPFFPLWDVLKRKLKIVAIYFKSHYDIERKILIREKVF